MLTVFNSTQVLKGGKPWVPKRDGIIIFHLHAPIEQSLQRQVEEEDVLMGRHEYTWPCQRNWLRRIKYSSQWTYKAGFVLCTFNSGGGVCAFHLNRSALKCHKRSLVSKNFTILLLYRTSEHHCGWYFMIHKGFVGLKLLKKWDIKS